MKNYFELWSIYAECHWWAVCLNVERVWGKIEKMSKTCLVSVSPYLNVFLGMKQHGRRFFFKETSWNSLSYPNGPWLVRTTEVRMNLGDWKNDTAEYQTSLWGWGTEEFLGLGQFFCLCGERQTFSSNSFPDLKSLGWWCWKRRRS